MDVAREVGRYFIALRKIELKRMTTKVFMEILLNSQLKRYHLLMVTIWHGFQNQNLQNY